MIDNKRLILDICNISIRAGNKILEYYKDDIEVTHKSDSSLKIGIVLSKL